MNTSWSAPKTNLFQGIWSLRNALANGYKAKLVRMRNEDCVYPIGANINNTNFRDYEFSIGYQSTIDEINKTNRPDFIKHLSLNYISVFGTEEAIQQYYKTGVLSYNNFHSTGINHLVHVDDYIKFLDASGDISRANKYRWQYRNPNTTSQPSFFDFFRLKNNQIKWNLKKFKHKLWVVALLDEKEIQPKVPLLIYPFNALAYLLKFIPKKSILKMSEYTNVTFRVGGVSNGYSIEFQIPRKFSFK